MDSKQRRPHHYLADCSQSPHGQCFSLAAIPRLHHLSAALINREREALCTLDSISLLKHKLSFMCGKQQCKIKSPGSAADGLHMKLGGGEQISAWRCLASAAYTMTQ